MRKAKKVRWILLLLSTVFTLVSIPATSIKSSMELEEYNISDSDIEDNLRKDYKSLFQSIAYEPEAFGLISEDLEGLSFMQAIRFITPDTTESDLLSNKNNHVIHIPLMNKRKEIVLIYSVIKTDEGLSATLGIDFAPMLNEALELGFSDVVLMQDTDGLYARDLCSHVSLKMEGAKVVRTAKQEASSTFLLNVELSDLVKIPYVVLSLDSIDLRLSQLSAQSLTDGKEGCVGQQQ